MPNSFKQRGFVPPLVIILFAIIAVAATIVVKNFPLNQLQPNYDTGSQRSNNTQTKPTLTPTPTKSVSIKISPTNSPAKTKTGSSTPTPTPTPTLTSSPASTPTTTPTPLRSGTVQGTVKLTSGTPLGGVSVNLTCNSCNTLLNGNVQATTTDNSGAFTFNKVPTSTPIQLIALAYAKWTDPIDINLSAGQTLTRDILVTLPLP